MLPISGHLVVFLSLGMFLLILMFILFSLLIQHQPSNQEERAVPVSRTYICFWERYMLSARQTWYYDSGKFFVINITYIFQ